MTAGSIALHRLAAVAGLAPVWHDVSGQVQQVSEDSLRSVLTALGWPCAAPGQIEDSYRRLRSEDRSEHAASSSPLWIVDSGRPYDFPWSGPFSSQLVLESGRRIDGLVTRQGPGVARLAPIHQPGYHHLYVGNACILLAVCPSRCPAVPPAQSARRALAWGIAAQVYSLREEPSRGRAGDFSVLADFAARAGQAGASAVAISPVHAMFSASPQRYSPYSPSSRLFLNTAYADPALMTDEAASASQTKSGAGVPTAAARQRSLVRPNSPATFKADDARAGAACANIDWPAHVRDRLAALRGRFDAFDRSSDQAPARDFRRFCLAGGEALESHARYEALSLFYCQRLGPDSGWQDWPASLHNPGGAAAERFAAHHREDVDFHCFVQWLADRGLAAAQAAARGSGMSIGLITDLAIGTDARGSHAWSRQNEILRDVVVGAPPDLFQPQGQDWGITAFSPHALRRNGYAGFIETLRANLRHAGGLRIDHIMGLARMWLVPTGALARDGVYLRYPFADMVRLLVLEAWRHNAIIIGENLGTVAPGFNRHLEEKGILGTSVLWFEQEGAWPGWTMATTSTHDLPTLQGWWSARDVQWRARLGQLTALQARHACIQRRAEKDALLKKLPSSEKISPNAMMAPRQAMLTYVAGTPGPLVIIPVEDVLGLAEQPNLPGTAATACVSGASHPSWIQRLPQSVDALFSDAGNLRSLESIRQGRAAAAHLAAPSGTGIGPTPETR